MCDEICYPSDLSDSAWLVLKPLFASIRKTKYPMAHVFNAILYVLFSGCAWRSLPKDYPPYQIVFYYFNKWRKNQTFCRLLSSLQEKSRQYKGLQLKPSTISTDSQTIRTQGYSEKKGYDAYKRKTGHKRNVICDSQSIPLTLCITPADSSDGEVMLDTLHEKAAELLGFKRLLADRAYQEKGEYFVREVFDATLELSQIDQDKQKGFKLHKGRWVVEKCFAFKLQARRLVVDYERTVESVAAFIQLRFIALRAKRRALEI